MRDPRRATGPRPHHRSFLSPTSNLTTAARLENRQFAKCGNPCIRGHVRSCAIYESKRYATGRTCLVPRFREKEGSDRPARTKPQGPTTPLAAAPSPLPDLPDLFVGPLLCGLLGYVPRGHASGGARTATSLSYVFKIASDSVTITG